MKSNQVEIMERLSIPAVITRCQGRVRYIGSTFPLQMAAWSLVLDVVASES